MTIDRSAKITPVPGVHLTELQDSAVALNLNNENYYGLNSTALRIYQILIESNSIQMAIETLIEEFEAPQTEIEADVMELLRELESNGLINITNP